MKIGYHLTILIWLCWSPIICRQRGKFREGKVVGMCNMVVKEVDETMFMNEIESTNALGSWLYGWKGNLK